MPIHVKCNTCSKAMLVGDHVAGKKFRCPDCGAILQAPLLQAELPRKTVGPQRRERPGQPPAEHAPNGQRRTKRTTKSADQQSKLDDNWGSMSSYDDPAVPVSPKPKPQHRSPQTKRRESHPGAFEEYDKLVNECAIFLSGISLVIGLLMSMIYFSDNAPSNPARSLMIYKYTMITVGALLTCGVSCLTRWRAVIVVVLILCIMIGAPLLLWTFVAEVRLLAIFPIGILAVSAWLSMALRAFP